MRVLSRLVTKLRRPKACWRERMPGTLYVGGRPIQGNVYVDDASEFERMIAYMERDLRWMAEYTALPIHLYPR